MMHDNAAYKEITARRCSECGEGIVVRSMENQEFAYGSGEEAVRLRVQVPVWSCAACGDAYTDAEAEDIRHEAVCRHLKRLTPAEIKSIRKRKGLTQEEFADQMRLGLASIKRWESGNQIQSASSDILLRFVRDDHAGRLEAIVSEMKAGAATTKEFRTSITADARARAQQFELCPPREAAEA